MLVFLNRVAGKVSGVGLYRYVLFASVTSFLGGSILIFISEYLISSAGIEIHTINRDINLNSTDIFGYIIFAPLLESFLIAFFSMWYKPNQLNKHTFSFIIAFIFAMVHIYFVPMSFLGVLFSFYIYAYSYLIWREKVNRYIGYWSAAIPHIIANAIALSIVFTLGE